MKQLPLFPEEEKPKNDFWENSSHCIKNIPAEKPGKKTFKSKEEYYQSEEWKIVRAFALQRSGNRCEWCGASGVLEVHHLTYDNLYSEKPEDLQVLCKKHHKIADRKRARENWYKNSLDSYLETKYRNHAEYFPGCEEEFDKWIETKSDYDDDWYHYDDEW